MAFLMSLAPPFGMGPYPDHALMHAAHHAPVACMCATCNFSSRPATSPDESMASVMPYANNVTEVPPLLRSQPISVPVSLLKDANRRDTRCCRALYIKSLPELLAPLDLKGPPLSGRFDADHFISPVGADGCAVCGFHASPPRGGAAAAAAGIAKPDEAVAEENEAAEEKSSDCDDAEGSQELENGSDDDAALAVPAVLGDATRGGSAAEQVRAAMDYAATGTRRPSRFLSQRTSRRSSNDSAYVVEPQPRKRRRQKCRHRRSRFNSTSNSKRRVHTFLFWKRQLGCKFPVVDMMLRDVVWRNLESCDYGIKSSNGHAKNRPTGVCVNPDHYYPTDYAVMLDALLEGLECLRILPKHATIAELVARRHQGVSDEEVFRLLCLFVRQMPIAPFFDE